MVDVNRSAEHDAMENAEQRRPWLVDALVLLLLGALTLIFFYRIALTNRVLAGLDVFAYFYPYRDLASEALRAGRLPLWNPYLFMGAPFLANSQVAVLYPLHWPLLWLSTPKQIAWSIVLHVWLAGAGTYLFARGPMRLRPLAALVAATIFGLGGFLGAQVEHVNQLNASAWLPWLLLCLEGVMEPRYQRWRWPGLLCGGGIAGLILLAGHTQAAYILFAGAGAYALFRGFPDLRSRRWLAGLRGLGALGAMALMGAILAAGQLLPTLELSGLSVRSGGLPYNEAASFSLKPGLVFKAFLPPLFWEPPFSEYVAYAGLVGLALAALGTWAILRRQRPGGAVLGLALLGLFLAFGAYNPVYYVLYKLVPGFDLFRAPARWLLLYAFGVALLAGIGLEAVGEMVRRRAARAAGEAAGSGDPAGAGPGAEGHGKTAGSGDPAGAGVGALGAGRAAGAGDPAGAGVGALEAGRAAGAGDPAGAGSGALGAGRAAGAGDPAGAGAGAQEAGRLAGSGDPARAQEASAGARELGGVRLWQGGILLLLVLELFVAGRRLAYNRPTAPAAFDSLRTAPSHLLADAASASPAGPEGALFRFLSMSDIGYDPGDMGDLQAMYGSELSEEEIYDLIVATKMKEVLAFNLPLRYRLFSVDGYDGGLLPIEDYVTLEKLFLAEDEIWPDGRLRQQLRRVPPARLLSLLNVKYLITDKTQDVWIDDVFYDLEHTLPLGQVRLGDLPDFWTTDLGMVSYLTGTAHLEDRTPVAQVTITGTQGEVFTTELLAGEHTAEGIYSEVQVAHRQARVGHRWRDNEPGNDYIAVLGLEEAMHPWEIAVRALLPDDQFHLRGLTLIDRDSGTSRSLSVDPAYRLVHSGDVKVYQNLTVLPRAFVVHQAKVVADEGQALARLRDPGFDPAQTVILDQGQELASPGGLSSVEILAYAPERIELRASLDRPGYLVLTDTDYPGWEARVDEIATPIHRANLYFRAVPLEAGEHEITFLYQPSSVWAGLGLGMAGWTVLLLVLAVVLIRIGRK